MRVLVAALLVAIVAGHHEPIAIAYAAAPRADVQLKQVAATITNTSNTAWILQKVGSLGPSTIDWQVTATEGVTTPGLLILNGIFVAENRGTAGATIGNVVVNLQQKVGNSWVSVSTNVADATLDDGATTARVATRATADNVSAFTENSASGALLFTDALTNSAFALVPQVTIPPRTIKTLRFSATFDNSLLNLAVGAQVRAEIFVSFGNARHGGPSTPNLDINGNGIIDSDEDYIQSVGARIASSVPAPDPSNNDVMITDSPGDITTTGTVTFSNPRITISGTQALVVVDYSAGAEGGTITNCAHLTGLGSTARVLDDEFTNLTGVGLTACNTITIGVRDCNPGIGDCGWRNGDMISYGQESWGGDRTTSTAAGLLYAQFDAQYPGGLEVGVGTAAGFSMIFTSGDRVLFYAPGTGTPGPLTADLVDPSSTASGVFGGQVLALQVNVDFSDAGLLSGRYQYGNLHLCGLTQTPLYNGLEIRMFLDAMSVALSLSSGIPPYTYDELSALVDDVTRAFEGGAPSSFAQNHVFASQCP
jgi:hypothetical protein